MDYFKVFTNGGNKLKVILSAVKYSIDDIGMDFGSVEM